MARQIIAAECGPHYTPTITSAKDAVHSKNSRHYSGNAVDIRTKEMPHKKRTVRKLLKHFNQKPNFTALFEDSGRPNEHLHLQFNE